eukprot:scaffold4716_cov18-Tisochrysis_lutea.AAC.1
MMPAAIASLLRSPPLIPRSDKPPGSAPPTCRHGRHEDALKSHIKQIERKKASNGNALYINVRKENLAP